METNRLPGGIFSGMGGGMPRLEMNMHHHQQQQNVQNPHLQQNQMIAYTHHEPEHPPQSQQGAKHGYQYAPKSKQQFVLSDEDEPAFNQDDSAGDGKRKVSPWHRMKWTDSMVKLLIMAVYYIGDEGGSDGNDPFGKKKAGGLLQKKGKWKSVSGAMMEKGFYVSPQQCEDKFNDLNKRYKRVNDILGKGTACRVVENPNLLEMMDLSPKMKEEVRKLLISKHLFFREMCAYHNSCGHVSGATTQQSPESHAEPSRMQAQQQQAQLQRCFHSSEHVQVGHSSGRAETEGSKMKGGSGEEDDDEEDDVDSEDDEDEAEVVEGGLRGHDEDDENENGAMHKRPRVEGSLVHKQLSCEMLSVMQDGFKSMWEKMQWMKSQLLQLEEQQVSYQCQGMELEKQRLKWVKFSGKKEREMERAKLMNERRKLEIDRMVLLIRQKEFELLDLQQQQHSSNKRGDPSSITR